MCAAHGVPPKWVDSIQGAELWAVNMALQHVQCPEKLYSDCDSVRLGAKKSLEWATSSKRRHARIWSTIALQIEGATELIQWMPAHTSEASIGERLCSDGVPVSGDLWSANQIVDMLAKQSADSVRLSQSFRSSFNFKEAKAFELAKYLGQVTFEANNHVSGDGKVIRDSEPMKRVRHPGRNDPKKVKKDVIPRRTTKERSSFRNQMFRNGSGAKAKGPSTCKATKLAKHAKVFETKQQAAFLEWWQEARKSTLKPLESTAPTAKERQVAMAGRIAAKNAAAST